MSTSPALSFQEVKTRRVFEEICEQIRKRLASGALKPGDKLPAERDLAVEFKVSRPAVREALRTLEISGVVSLQKGVKGGAFIRDGNPAMLTQSLQDLMILGRVTLAGLAEARRLINGMVIELACERATEEDFLAIERNIEEIDASEDLVRRADAGVRFFGLIARATRNEVLTMLVDSLSDIIRYVIDTSGRKARPELVPVRRNLLKAMRARDAKAAVRHMDQYLTIVQEGMDAAPAVAAAPAPAPARKKAGARPVQAAR
ncbi:FadR/GntR family transcriptional regulator [Xenophilus arseniciresistens]|uniref:FadR/GntR family transcriptional regulator n=1 Tax=Xenophilus arseniciresistens TaxID=1283306 RepID=A0AAE3NEV6_9BURK|nr:FadR/GntR family transcriptional regulator [Xenophilus arseniciresistens]MDA7419007.1 FadR/GntR family transcriptional regulator [Xenophilus arseniciresistens]